MSTTYPHSTTIPEITKRIAYNRETRDYDCFIAFDGGDEQPIGSASTYGSAEKKCSDYAFDYYNDNHTPEKAAQIALSADIPADEELNDRIEKHRRIGYIMGSLTVMLDKIDADRAECLTDLFYRLSTVRGAERETLIDVLLLAATSDDEPASAPVRRAA